jgi:hypothetical protein
VEPFFTGDKRNQLRSATAECGLKLPGNVKEVVLTDMKSGMAEFSAASWWKPPRSKNNRLASVSTTNGILRDKISGGIALRRSECHQINFTIFGG